MADPILLLPSYQIMRRALSERVAPLAIISGSGLSAPAGLPNWAGLRKVVQQKLDDLERSNNESDVPYDGGLHKTAKTTKDYWLFFKLAKKALSPATFREIIRGSLAPADLELPSSYLKLLALNPRGIVTLNLDRLSALAVASAHPGVPIAQIFGTELARKWQQITDENPFLVYLHGSVADPSTWILDSDELKALTSNPAHALFLSTLYMQYTVLFVGMSADDVAVSRSLLTLNQAGFTPPRLFWLTSRTNQATTDWAALNNVQLIKYNASSDKDHERVIGAIVDDVAGYLSVDPRRPPPKTDNLRTFTNVPTDTTDPSEIALLTPEDARKVLSNILSIRLSSFPSDLLYERFLSFAEEYDYPIQTRSFYRHNVPPNDTFFGYKLVFPAMGVGNFGTVYQGTAPNGDPVAVKIMHNNILNNEEMLGGFRRGSASLKIITESRTYGVVSLIESFEIPPTIVMEFIAGNSLSELFDDLSKFPWHVRVGILSRISEIVDACHKLPQFVLHRDIKPSNIMIEGLDYFDYSYSKLVVLDFDMSWHKGSSEKDVVFESRDDFGYLAPEQTDTTKIGHSRSTKVDSYGLGMTSYAVMGGLHPIPNVPLDPNWSEFVFRASRSGYKGDWLCLPRRLARFVLDSTEFDYSKRLEFSSGRLRLVKIFEVGSGKAVIAPIDVVAEELLAIVGDGMAYGWDDIVDSGSVRFANGSGLEVSINLGRPAISIKVTYDDTGAKNYANRNSLVGACRDYFFELGKEEAVSVIGLNIGSGQLRFAAELQFAGSLQETRKWGERLRDGIRILMKI